MRVFMCHSSLDKDVVEPIGTYLSARGMEVWIDTWRMTPGDSLVQKIGEGIEAADRLVVFLSANSVDAPWVMKEMATGLVMELAKKNGCGEKFVVPALLTACKIPTLLCDKVYANFTNKEFGAACEELARGLAGTPAGPASKKLENTIVNLTPSVIGNRHRLVVEFGVRISPTEGLHIGIDVGAPFDRVDEWFGLPGTPVVPPYGAGGTFTLSATRNEPPIYARRFSSPNLSSSKSYYLMFEGPSVFVVKPGNVQFLDYHDRVP